MGSLHMHKEQVWLYGSHASWFCPTLDGLPFNLVQTWDDFEDPLSFYLAPSAGQSFYSASDIQGPQRINLNDT